MSARPLLRSFAGGEIAPELYGRLDLEKYTTGLALCENMIALPHGPVTRRPGSVFVREVYDSLKEVVLIPFVYNTEQAYVLEFGDQYLRIHTEGGTVLDGLGAPLEVTTPYLIADLFDIHYVQSADVLTLVHPGYQRRELRRIDATTWTLTEITSGAPAINPPVGITAVRGDGAGDTNETYTYKITSVAESSYEESYASASASVQNKLAATGRWNNVGWGAVTGAVRYNVYKLSNGLYGYIGQAEGTSFKDDNLTADITRTPPEEYQPFSGAGNYPRAVGYFQGRRLFAGSENAPQTTWATRSGTESNMSRSLPPRDDDSMTLKLSSRQANVMRHIVPLSDVLLLSSSAEWRLTAGNAEVLSPMTASYKPEGYNGASNVQPVVTGGSVVYAQDRGGHLRELLFSWEAQGYRSNDISVMVPHLTDDYIVKQLALCRATPQVVWVLRTDGVLLGVTYVPEHKVIAWHRHDLGGVVESICAIPEGADDVLYMVVKRRIDGADRRYVEYLHPRRFDTQADAFFVDCGATYSGLPVQTVSGLDHLEGMEVAILADGGVHPPLFVDGGAITLEAPASKIHVGLPFTSRMQTLPLAVDGVPAAGQGWLKAVNRVMLRVVRSGGMTVQVGDDVREYPPRGDEPWGTPPALISGDVDIDPEGGWDVWAQITVSQPDPLPLTISLMVVEAEIGG